MRSIVPRSGTGSVSWWLNWGRRDAGAVDLGGVISLRKVRLPQFVPFRGIQVPRQEPLDILRNLTPGRRAALEVPRQPSPGIELPQRQRGKDREQRRHQLATPERTRAIEVLPRYRRAARPSF